MYAEKYSLVITKIGSVFERSSTSIVTGFSSVIMAFKTVDYDDVSE